MLKTNLTTITVFVGNDYDDKLMLVMIVEKDNVDKLTKMVSDLSTKYHGRQHKILEEEYCSVDSYIEDMLEKQSEIDFAWAGGYELHIKD